jgi:hypothetical protein
VPAHQATAAARGLYDIGEALREIVRDWVHAALGYASFDALLEERELVTSICTRTRPVGSAAQDLRVLGAGVRR